MCKSYLKNLVTIWTKEVVLKVTHSTLSKGTLEQWHCAWVFANHVTANYLCFLSVHESLLLTIKQWFWQHLSYLLPHTGCSFSNTVYKDEAYGRLMLVDLSREYHLERTVFNSIVTVKKTKQNKTKNMEACYSVAYLNGF